MDVRWVAYVGSAVIAVASLAPVTWFRPATTPAADRRSTPTRESTQEPLLVIQQHARRLTQYRENAPAPRPPDRNPFQFRVHGSPRPPLNPSVGLGVAAPLPPATPQIRLIGMMERTEAGSRVRVAVISDERDVYLVKVGDAVGERYRVDALEEESVVLADRETSGTLRLELER